MQQFSLKIKKECRPLFNYEWDSVLKDETEKDYFKNLTEYVEEQYASKTI